jgi:hypothetical protein
MRKLTIPGRLKVEFATIKLVGTVLKREVKKPLDLPFWGVTIMLLTISSCVAEGYCCSSDRR